MTRSTPALRRAEAGALGVLLLFTLLAIGGYWNFALHPERIPQSPFAAQFFAISFQFFAQLHIVLSAVALGVVLVGRLRARWVPAAAAVCVLAFLSEHVGTGYGIPFGGYGYTGLLGAKIGGRVPALIPLSWLLMALPSWVLAHRAFPSAAVRRVVVASLMLVAWDLALDPAMSFLTPYWVWEETGPYYGMPWMNLLGWFVTGVALMAVLEGLAGRRVAEALPVRWMAAYYGVVLLLPLGMVAAAGHALAVVVTLAAVGGCFVLVRGAFRAGDAASTAEVSLDSAAVPGDDLHADPAGRDEPAAFVGSR